MSYNLVGNFTTFNYTNGGADPIIGDDVAFDTIHLESSDNGLFLYGGGGFNTTDIYSGAGDNFVSLGAEVYDTVNLGVDSFGSTVTVDGGSYNNVIDAGDFDSINVDFNSTNASVELDGTFDSATVYNSSATVSSTGNSIIVENYFANNYTTTIQGDGGNTVTVESSIYTATVRDMSAGSDTINVGFGYTANVYTYWTADRTTINLSGGTFGDHTTLNLSGFGYDTINVASGTGFGADTFATITDTTGSPNTINVGSYSNVTVSDSPSDTIVVAGAYNYVTAVGDFIALDGGASDDRLYGNSKTIATDESSTITAGFLALYANTGGSLDNYVYGSGNLFAIQGAGTTTNVGAGGLSIELEASGTVVNLYGNNYGIGGNSITLEGGVTATINDTTAYGYAANTINVDTGATATVDSASLYADTINVQGDGFFPPYTTVNLSGAGGDTINIGSGYGFYETFEATSYTDATINDSSAFRNYINVGTYVRVGVDSSSVDQIAMYGSYSTLFASGEFVEWNGGSSGNTIDGNNNTVAVVGGSDIYTGISLRVSIDGNNYNYVDGAGNSIAIEGTGSTSRIDSLDLAVTVYAAGATVNLDITGEYGGGGNTITVASGHTDNINDYTGHGYVANTINVEEGSNAVIYNRYGIYDTINLGGGYRGDSSTATLSGYGKNTVVVGSETYAEVIQNDTSFGNIIEVSGTDSIFYMSGSYGYIDSIRVLGSGNSVFVYDASTVNIYTGAIGNSIEFDSETFPVSGPNLYDTFNDLSNGGNTVEITGQSAVEVHADNDIFNLSGNSAMEFGSGSYGRNSVNIYDGSTDTVYENSTGGANTIHVSDGSGLIFESASRGDTLYLSGKGGDGQDSSVFFEPTMGEGGPPSTGGSTVVVASGAYASVYQGVYAGNTIVDGGTDSLLYVSGGFAYADTIVLSGQSDHIGSNGDRIFDDYIEVTGTAATDRVWGSDNTIAVESASIIYAVSGEFISVNSTGVADGGVYSTDTMVYDGSYNGVVIEAAGSTNQVYAGYATITVGAVATVDLHGFSEDDVVSGGNTITVDTDDVYQSATIKDLSTGYNTINVVDHSGAYITASNDTVYIASESWAELSGTGGNSVSFGYDTRNNWFYDDSSAANTVTVYGADATIVQLGGVGDTINVSYGSSVSLYGAGGSTVNLLWVEGGDNDNSIYAGSMSGDTINVASYGTTYLSGRGLSADTVVVSGSFNFIYANNASIEVSGRIYDNYIEGSDNTIVDSSRSEITLEAGGYMQIANYNYDFEGFDRVASVYSKGFGQLYGSNALTIQGATSRIYENVGGDFTNTINITDSVIGDGTYSGRVYLFNESAKGDQVNLNGYSDLFIYDAGGNTVTVDGGTYGGAILDRSLGNNTINVSNDSDVFVKAYGDTVNITDFSFAQVYTYRSDVGSQINVGGGAAADLFGYGSNAVTVIAENSATIDDRSYANGASNYANTINVIGGGYVHGQGIIYSTANIYTEFANGDTINLGGYTSANLSGAGGNTIVVDGWGNNVADNSSAASTINLTGESGLYLDGEQSSADTVVVSGYENWVYNGGHFIEMNGSAGLFLDGDRNTIAVSGTQNYLYDGSGLTNNVMLNDEAGLFLEAGNYDTIAAVTGATGNEVTLYGGSKDLVTLNGNSGSTVAITASNATEFINAGASLTNDMDTIDISGNNVTVYIWDSSFVAGDSSDALDVTGTGDTVKFVNTMITAAAAFGTPTSSASLVVEDSYVGATAINAVSHH